MCGVSYVRAAMIDIFEHNPINPLTQWMVRSCHNENAMLLGDRRLSNNAF
jgi:hypothetical protein